METLLKWLNKPKADDKSLLARFFHADRALTAVASELDSFDGRAEPDRCSRLVSRLRQGQDKVLAITNLIIEELLGDERDQRAFRAKFPEEVLQENLAGQLWFGAECLAAGSSIMNREQESKEMRPLAEAVTRSLNNVRYLLRDQCLRNNVPNSERLNLDKNDAATEQLYESLKRFDRLFAEFEWRYVSAMVQVKSKEEYEMQELICVLCSETLQRALKLGLLEQEKVDAFDPALMFSIPRLAIVSGLVIYPDGPLNMDMPAEQLSEMFRPFRSILLKVRDYLRNLNETELYYLERLLCTNEEISLKDTLNAKDAASVVADNNNSKSSKYSEHSPAPDADDEGLENASSLKTTTTTTSKLQQKSTSTSTTTSTSTCKTFKTKPTRRADSPSPATSTTSSSSSDECSPYNTPVSSTPSSPRSSHSLVSTSSAGNDSNGTTSPDSWIDDDNENDVEEDDDEEEDLNDNFLAARDEDDHYADDDDSDVNSEEDDDDDDEVNKNLKYMTDEENINLELVSADCNTGYLISNTTLGNLLQPQEVPLTDNFIVSVSDLPSNTEDSNDNLDLEMPTTSAKLSNVNTSRQEQEQLAKENHVNNNSANTRNRSYLAGDLIDDITSNYLIHMAYADDSDLEGTIREINHVTQFHEDCNDNVDVELPSTSTKLVKNTSTSRQLSKSTSCVQDSSLGDNYIPTSDCHDECSTTNAGDSDLEDKNINMELPSTSDKLLNVASAATKTSRENSVDALIECSTTNPSSDLHCAGDSDLEGTTTTSTSTSSCTRRRHYSNDLTASTQSQSQCQQQQQQQLCTKDHARSHRHHHHRHHHHHHHHNHHNNHHTHTTSTSSTNNRSTTNSQHQSNQSHHRHRGHHVHNHGHSHGHNHGHGHHHRRPNRHGGDKQHSTLTRDECIPKEDSTMENSKATSSIGVLDIETPSSSSSLMEDNKTVARSSGRSKFKHTENLLHRLFVCIAGVADQLQTNFAFDLRQILRSVFLMNMSPALEELDIPEKPKDNELFEFRASENDVIQESAGSSQSIYSAEEVNPEGDNQSNSSSNSSSSSNTSSGGSNEGNRAYRHSTGTTTITTTTTATTFNENDGGGVIAVANVNQRQQIERSRSLDNQDCNTTTIVAQTQQQRQNPPSQQLRHNQHVFRNRYNSTGSNSPSISSSENSSPICERSTNTTNRRVSESNANLTQSQQQLQQQQQQQPTSPVHLSPPAWIPDQKAPRCMSCNTPFTAFRRRHHCRNCGGVFCGVCSNNSTPLPKYGLTKAVRVCRSCYIHELTTSSAINNHHHHHPHNNQHHNHNHHNYHSQLVSQTTNTTTTTNTTNNEPRLRRPVTTTRAID